MYAFSTWQPYASLLAVGAKRFETRGWPAPAHLFGERIAIQAAKNVQALGAITHEPFASALVEAYQDGRLVLVDDKLPLGAIVATATLRRVITMTESWIEDLRRRDEREALFGAYAVGRYAWEHVDVVPLRRPVPFRGRQKLFEVPDELVLEAA